MTKEENERLEKIDTRLGNLEKAVEKIITNDLPYLNNKLTIQLGGLVFIGIMIALLGIVVAVR